MLAHQDGPLFPLWDGCIIVQYHSTIMGTVKQATQMFGCYFYTHF